MVQVERHLRQVAALQAVGVELMVAVELVVTISQPQPWHSATSSRRRPKKKVNRSRPFLLALVVPLSSRCMRAALLSFLQAMVRLNCHQVTQLLSVMDLSLRSNRTARRRPSRPRILSLPMATKHNHSPTMATNSLNLNPTTVISPSLSPTTASLRRSSTAPRRPRCPLAPPLLSLPNHPLPNNSNLSVIKPMPKPLLMVPRRNNTRNDRQARRARKLLKIATIRRLLVKPSLLDQTTYSFKVWLAIPLFRSKPARPQRLQPETRRINRWSATLSFLVQKLALNKATVKLRLPLPLHHHRNPLASSFHLASNLQPITASRQSYYVNRKFAQILLLAMPLTLSY